jgi:DNA-binding response OmpR family regulator
MASRKVLIADPDVGAIRPLTRVLRARGYQVQYAGDGTKALEAAVLRHPDVILFDEKSALIDARAFIQILAANPRTSDIPVVVTVSGDLEAWRDLREGVLQKPFNVDEVIARLEQLCRRAEAAQELRGDAKEIEGALTQLPLADLLQILSMNRRTGRLLLYREREKGEVQIADGRPVNARLNEIEGDKALFRIIAWREGTFAFHPGPVSARARIDRSMEDALLEGMRQSDERERLLGGLPGLQEFLGVVPDAAALIDPHPVTKEVLRVLSQPRRLAEVLDLADAPDLDLLGAVATLLEKGVIQRVEVHDGQPAPLLGAAEVHALRGQLLRGQPGRDTSVAKLILCGTGPKAGRWVLHSLPGLLPTTSEPSCLRSSFGTLGQLDISGVLKVDFVLVPPSEAARPLWRPFLTGSLGAVVLEETDAALKLARYLAFELRLPVVVAAGPASGGLVTATVLPAALRSAPAGAVVVRDSLTAAVRAALVATLPTGSSADAAPAGEP